MSALKSPYPYFGGKSKVTPLIWERFGSVSNYVEPFFGSGAVLLGRPGDDFGTETVNDKHGMISNFWRAIQKDPEAVAKYADWPVNECDLHARHAWLVGKKELLNNRLEGDPDFYCPKTAGWWVWGCCAWIGGGFCSGDGPWIVVNGELVDSRQLPHLGDAGMGINRQLPHLGDAGMGILDAFLELSERLRGVRVACGDWSRVVGDSVTVKHGVSAVFLDPPYVSGEHSIEYAEKGDCCADDARKWAIANGGNKLLRIAYCGYEGLEFPDSWECVSWKAQGGYGSRGDGRGRENALRERIWFSPHCVRPESQIQNELF